MELGLRPSSRPFSTGNWPIGGSRGSKQPIAYGDSLGEVGGTVWGEVTRRRSGVPRFGGGGGSSEWRDGADN